jgi:hypothetical protein
MADINTALAESRAAVDRMLSAAERTGSAWATPRAPGKWSPSQIVEHVARALEESANAASGRPTRFPTFPVFLRPIVRKVFFDRTVRKGTFPKGKTNKAMNPESGPPTLADGRIRLEQAHAAFEQACRQCNGTFSHSIFGTVNAADYARFQAMHTLHHTKQIGQS